MNMMLCKFWKIGASRVTAQLNIDNLTDKTYIGSIYSYDPSHYGAPRTFMGAIKKILRKTTSLRVPNDCIGSLHANFGPGMSVGLGKRLA